MFFKNLAKKYFNLWINWIDFQSKAKLISIDFNQPWWTIIAKQKLYILCIIIVETIDNLFYYSIPLFIGWLISSGKLYYFFIFISAWLLAITIEYFSLYFASIVHMQTTYSVLYNAHKHFLTVDPIFHTTRASGKIIGKIERGVGAFEDFLDLIAFDILATVVGISTVIFAFFKFDTKLGLIAFSMIFFISLFNTILQFLSTAAFEPRIIESTDKLNATSLENLTQVQYIRSCFASNEMDQSLKNSNREVMNIGGTSWLAFSAVTFATRFSFIISILILGNHLIHLVYKNQITIQWATALLLTFINGSYETMRIGKKIKRILRSLTRIKDLYSFIKTFGQQTFPVLSKQTLSVDVPLLNKNKDALVIDIQDLYFDYNSKAKIFENHYLCLEICRNDKNKLYGIIGPSGSGKTTFISILGGQIHPTYGSVKIQDVDIYQVDDFTRKYLVSLQGQIATSLRGTIRYNLFFGLPKDKDAYTDTDLIAVLEAVGLWQLFASKEGLETLIGESGLNLSGGQRQRLNFANLYLRAKYYNPALILIDEPTSSLDEVSEKAITNMIDELAQNAITFVIAHRINTLEKAVAILDFSLLSTQKEITFYPPKVLVTISAYYKKLIKGEIVLE